MNSSLFSTLLERCRPFKKSSLWPEFVRATQPQSPKHQVPMDTFVLVYGPLREGMSHPLRNLFLRHGIFLGTGTFRGKLYDLGRYPGAVVSDSSKDRVIGEVFRIK